MKNTNLIIFDWKRTLYDPDKKELIDGALDLLKFIHKKGIKIILIGKGGEDMKEEVKRLQVGDYFFKIVFCDQAKDIEIYRPYITKQNPKDTLFIGDRIHSELEVGKKLGATTVWIRQGKFATEEPQTVDQQPDFTISTLNDCLNLFIIGF